MPIDPEKGIHIGTVTACILGIAGQMIFHCLFNPILPFIVKIYFPGIDVSDIGYYSGYLLSMYNLGNIVGAIFWGWYSDQYGRKRAALIISFLNVICIFALGISRNYYLSLFIRLIHGLSDGLLNVSKTILSELSNDRNTSFVISLNYLGGVIGRLIGPLMSGYLASEDFIRPLAAKYPFFKKYPFFIAFTIAALVFVIVIFIYLFFAEETLSQEEMERARQYKEEMKREMSNLGNRNSLDRCNSREKLLLQYKKYSNFWSILSDRDVLLSILFYSIHSLSQSGYDGLLPNVLVNHKSMGGFEFETKSIGFVQMMSSPMAFTPILLCYYLQCLLPYRKQMNILNFFVTLWLVIYPIQSHFNNIENTTLEYAIVTFMFCLLCSTRAVLFNVIITVCANVAYKEVRGTVIGLSQTISAIGRFIGPTIIPPLYAWSCHHNSFFINHRLAFYVLALIIIFCFPVVHFMTEVSDQRRGSILTAVEKEEVSGENGEGEKIAENQPSL